MQGFVSVHRKLMNNPIWSDPHYVKLWMYCLFQASHKQHEQLVGNNMITLERGQFITGRHSLADDLNSGMKPKQKLNEKTWFRYLNNLEKWGMLTIKSTNKYSVVTIDKYDFYQTPGNNYDQQTDQQMSNSCPSDVQQMSTNNNDNNGNNKKRRKLIYDNNHFQLAEYFYNQILKNNPEHKKPNLEKWANDVRLMMDIDKRTEEQIKYLMKWVQQDSFEMSNVLSPSKLRERFDPLVMKVKKEKGQTTSNKQDEPVERKVDVGDELNEAFM